MKRPSNLVISLLGSLALVILFATVYIVSLSTKQPLEPYWKTYFEASRGDWNDALELEAGHYIHSIYHGIDYDSDHYAYPGKEMILSTTNNYYKDFSFHYVSNKSSDHNEVTFEKKCGIDQFIQDAKVWIDENQELQYIGYKCLNIYNGRETWEAYIPWTATELKFGSGEVEDPFYFCGVQVKLGDQDTNYMITGLKYKLCPLIMINDVSFEYDFSSIHVENEVNNLNELTFKNSQSEAATQTASFNISYTHSSLWEADDLDFNQSEHYNGRFLQISFNSTTQAFESVISRLDNFTFNANHTSSQNFSLNETIIIPSCTEMKYTYYVNVTKVQVPFDAIVSYTDGNAYKFSGTHYKTLIIDQYYTYSWTTSVIQGCSPTESEIIAAQESSLIATSLISDLPLQGNTQQLDDESYGLLVLLLCICGAFVIFLVSRMSQIKSKIFQRRDEVRISLLQS